MRKHMQVNMRADTRHATFEKSLFRGPVPPKKGAPCAGHAVGDADVEPTERCGAGLAAYHWVYAQRTGFALSGLGLRSTNWARAQRDWVYAQRIRLVLSGLGLRSTGLGLRSTGLGLRSTDWARLNWTGFMLNRTGLVLKGLGPC